MHKMTGEDWDPRAFLSCPKVAVLHAKTTDEGNSGANHAGLHEQNDR